MWYFPSAALPVSWMVKCLALVRGKLHLLCMASAYSASAVPYAVALPPIIRNIRFSTYAFRHIDYHLD